MVLVTVEFGIGVGQEVVDIATDTPPADPALLVATAAGFVMQLHARRITAAAADVVDGTAECQRAMLETVGPAQHFHARQPQRFQQLVGRAARSGQRQAIDRHGNTRGVRARAAVDAGAADGDLVGCRPWPHR
ncbi:hypothetical protein G6F40_015761 [Rhizopus arrhizus]|nr:hypothetical protein G6F40_015761 [Rhizopus arrhizus]